MPGTLIRLLILLCLFVPASAMAREGGGQGGHGMSGGAAGGAGLSSAVTKEVVKILKSGGRECGALNKVYRYDCYRWAYKRAADVLSGRAAYKEAFRALVKVEEVLEREVARNADPATPPLRRGFTTYKAVKPQAVPKVKAKAITALEEAETTLLRSSDDKGVHYANIAEAVNSNKVLLRSALLLIPGLRPLLVLFG